jgi:deoxyribodipyrimidine photo-lyase
MEKTAYDAFVEQLVVRRGLAFNHAAREPRHATWEAVPEWAKQTLAAHAKDERPEAKPPAKLERAQSDDPIWNAAQRELLLRGRIHNVLRMFWGKRLIQLCKRPRDAFELAVRCFDRYALDGRDPNTYAGIGWCFGLHDRPFPEREIFGTVRPMGLGAVKKRFDPKAWAKTIPQLDD